MPTSVHAPDGSIVNFPDGMSESDIEAAMRRNFPPAAPRRQAFMQEVTGSGSNLVNDIKTALAPTPPQPRRPNGPLPANANMIDKTLHFLAGGDTGTGEVQTNTPGGQAALAADRVSGDVMDLPMSLGRGVARFINPNLTSEQANAYTAAAAAALPLVGPTARGLVKAPAAIAKGGQAVANKAVSVIDAGATPAANSTISSAKAKILQQQQALADAQAAVNAGKAADLKLRPTMEAAAAEKSAQGISPADTPEAQALVSDLQGRLNPNGPVATIPTANQKLAYQKVIDTLAPEEGPKPDFATVQALRRDLGTAYDGDQTGYAAIDKGVRKNLVTSLNKIEDVYTGGLQAPVQDNYTALMDAQKIAKGLGKFSPDFTQATVKMDTLPPQEAVKVAQTIVDKMQKNGLVPQSEYQDFVQLAQNAKDAAGKSAFRKKVLLLGAGAVGLATPVGHLVLHAAGIP